MKKWIEVILPILLIGSVDLIDGDYAEVEITKVVDGEYEVVQRSIPLSLFPCEISEGDMFYFSYINDVTELRCGEPPA